MAAPWPPHPASRDHFSLVVTNLFVSLPAITNDFVTTRVLRRTAEGHLFRFLIKTRYRRFLVIERLKHRQEFGDGQKVVNLLGLIEKLQLAAVVVGSRVRADQLANAGAVNIRDVAKVEQYLFLALVEQAADGFPQLHAAFADCYFARKVQYRDVAYLAVPDVQISHLLRLLFCALALDLFHSHYASALGMNRMLDLIHESAHIKNAPATRVKQIIRICGIRQLVRVEAFPVISHVNRERPVSGNETNVHFFVSIAAVAVHDGVNDRLVHRELDPAGCVLVKSELVRYALSNRRYRLNVLEFAID